MAPRMNADEVSDYAVKAIGSGNYDVVVMNIANGDMVGHTGKLRAAVLAVEAADEAVGKVVSAARKVGGTVLIVADHGNAEQMIDYGTGSPHTQHTSGPVRAILVSEKVERRRQSGGLSDVAPTMLELLEVPKPPAMTGESMVRKPRKVMA